MVWLKKIFVLKYFPMKNSYVPRSIMVTKQVSTEPWLKGLRWLNVALEGKALPNRWSARFKDGTRPLGRARPNEFVCKREWLFGVHLEAAAAPIKVKILNLFCVRLPNMIYQTVENRIAWAFKIETGTMPTFWAKLTGLDGKIWVLSCVPNSALDATLKLPRNVSFKIELGVPTYLPRGRERFKTICTSNFA